MTYCASIHVNEGLVFLSDSRTNAGVDQLSTYSKMFAFGVDGERSIVILTGGNLATTQAVIKRIRKDINESADDNLLTIESIDAVAAYVGKLNLDQQSKHGNKAAGNKLDVSASYILGGQIIESKPELYLIYPEGNFIAATEQTPYHQSGEVKYGKPILDRIITADTSLQDAALCALVSMDSTMRSNATVGPPIELLLYREDSLMLDSRRHYEPDDQYLLSLRKAWEEELARGFRALPPLEMN